MYNRNTKRIWTKHKSKNEGQLYKHCTIEQKQTTMTGCKNTKPRQNYITVNRLQCKRNMYKDK